MKSFVRSSFYVQPPTNQASVKDWENWLTQDHKAAVQAKRAFTRSLKDRSYDDLPAMNTAKVNGVYKQVSAVGFSDGGIDQIVQATQELDVEALEARANKIRSRKSKPSKSKRKAQARFNKWRT
jgi:hypothetical protein